MQTNKQTNKQSHNECDGLAESINQYRESDCSLGRTKGYYVCTLQRDPVVKAALVDQYSHDLGKTAEWNEIFSAKK